MPPGQGDSFFANSYHNGQFYSRPDGRMLYFPHDTDFAFNASRNIFENTELKKLTANLERKRTYLANLHEICTSVYNQTWMAPGWSILMHWFLVEVFNDDLSYIHSRSTYILGQVSAQVPTVTFSITTNGGADLSTPSNPMELAGKAWLDVKEIRLSGSKEPLPLLGHRWTAGALGCPFRPTQCLCAGSLRLSGQPSRDGNHHRYQHCDFWTSFHR